jgi:uncharacterized protein DUF4304
MAKSEFVAKLDAIQKEANSKLRLLGFRKIGRNHSRTTGEGLIHVVNFQMNHFPIGVYGRFAVNLGVLLPCVHRLGKFPLPRSVTDAYCTICDWLPSRTEAESSFSLAQDSPTSPSSIVELLERRGLPFLAQFETYRDVLSYFQAHGNLPFQNPGRASLEAALVAREIGDIELSNRLFDAAHQWDHKGFREHVAEVANQFGHRVS